jgi:uridine kinase
MSEISEKKENSKQQTLRDRPFLIGISGGSGGGKTSVAYLLHICLGIENCLLFSMDTYYKDLTPEQEKNLNNYNFDTPDALDLDLLSEHLSSLMQWKSIEMPTYDFATNKRQKETKHLTPNKFIIFEGILAFHDKRMRDLMDLKLFIDLDDDIRLSRRIYRDIISRGRKMKDVLDRYHKFVKPAYNTFIKPTKAYADIIIPRGGSNTIAIDLINYYLKYNLTKVFPENINKFIVDSLTHNKDKIEKENKKNNNTNEIIEKEAIAELLKKETIELIKLEDIFEDNICLVDNEEKNLYFSIFKNYLSGQKIQYFDLYLDIFTKKINSIIKDNIIIFTNIIIIIISKMIIIRNIII